MTVRVYLPLTSTQFAAFVDESRLTAPWRGHAATDALRAEWPEGDEDDLEYAAMAAAGAASWQACGAGDRPRRYVLAVDVDGVRPAEGELTSVELTHDVVWRNVASAHVDTDDHDADPGDEDLAWFATQEIASLV